MGAYLNSERKDQLTWWKLHAQRTGVDPNHSGKHEFELPHPRKEENLYPPAAAAIQEYFRRNGITWHRSRGHLCSSQVACLNFLFPLGSRPAALTQALKRAVPKLARVLEIDSGSESPYVSFEFIGDADYLGEARRGKKKRTRGANCTSADAAVEIETTDGSTELVLIEWKLTESYGAKCLQVSESGTDRSAIYEPVLRRHPDFFRGKNPPAYSSMFFDPFYQLFRQQLLAAELEADPTSGFDKVRVLHISPRANSELHRVTSPQLKIEGDDALSVWKSALGDPDRFIAASTGDVFNSDWAATASDPAVRDWWSYVSVRYRTALR